MSVRRGVLVVALALAMVGSGAAAYAVFSSATSVGPNSLAAASDFTAPSVTSTAIYRAAGGSGSVRAGGTYTVYAHVTDTGNPASGVSTVTANVGALTSGQTAVTLTSSGGPFSVCGTTYAYKSTATLTESSGAGSYTYSVTSTDAAGNSRTQTGYPVTVASDPTAPAGSDVQATNDSGGTAGKAEAGDKVTFTFSEAMDPCSILAGWTGSSTSVVVRINNNAVSGNDQVQVYDSSNTSQLPLGSVNLASSSYVGSDRTFGVSGTASTMVMSGSTVTVTLGTASGSTTTALLGATMQWTPSSAATDQLGNACSASVVNESGGLADVEF